MALGQRIDRGLNLVIPVYGEPHEPDPADPKRQRRADETAEAHAARVAAMDEEKPIFWVHSMPISVDLYDRYWRVIAKAMNQLRVDGLARNGPRYGFNALRDAANELGDWDGPNGVEAGLLGEVKRLTNVVVPAAAGGGWSTLPLEIAVAQNIVKPGDYREVMQAIVFFICNSAEAPPRARKPILTFLFSPFGAEITSLNSTEFAGSLRTSSPVENSGEGMTAAVERPGPVGTTATITGPDGQLRRSSVPV